jgi:hypothetical protein
LSAPRFAGLGRLPSTWFLAYGGAFIVSEAVLIFGDIAVGVLLEAAILVVVISHSALTRPPRDPALPILALLPLIRLLSVALPIPGTAEIFPYALVGAPVLLGAVLSARAMGASRTDLGLGRPASIGTIALIAAIGLPLGLVARAADLILPLATGDANPLVVLAVVVLFVAFLEEFVFRGLLLRVASEGSRLAGIAAASVLYAAMYFGSGSAAAVVFMGLTGALFGYLAGRSGSLWGVLGAHLLLRLVVQI